MFKAKEINPEVFSAEPGPFVSIARSNVQMLLDRAADTPRRRSRFCAHPAVTDKLHEMFIVHEQSAYVRPHKHLHKAESLYVMEGEALGIFFDEAGKVTHVIELGDYASGKTFFLRVNEPTYHTLIITSPVFVFHETTTGPFDRADTIYPVWAPEEADLAGREAFAKRLEGEIELHAGRAPAK